MVGSGAPRSPAASSAVPVSVRDGDERDLPAVAAIYTHYVLKTTTTFNTQVRTPTEWVARHHDHVVDGPYDLLVAEREGHVVGFVETQPFRPKPAYDSSIEITIYVAPDEVGGGVGGALFDALFARLADSDLHRAYSVIALPNDRSIRFHERYGFQHRGTLTEAGRKFGRYLDVAFYERPL